MGNENAVAALIQQANAQIAGWRVRPVPRAAWHAADDIMVEAAMMDGEAVREAWEAVLQAYEEWVEWEGKSAP